MDERFVAAWVRGRGISVFSACSHAGIVNVCLDAKERFPEVPIDAVLGGYHLAGKAMETRIEPTIRDLEGRLSHFQRRAGVIDGLGAHQEGVPSPEREVPIQVPALRDRGNDVLLLFKKFASDFAENYRTKPATLSPAAEDILSKFRFPGNIRQLKNLAEQISVLEIERTIEAETVIIATGATAKWLGIPSEQEYNGYGVSACATCDGFFYRGLIVAVVGGGDTAAEEATYLAKLGKKVYLIHRRDELRASKAMQHKVLNTPNIELLWNYTTKEIHGETEGFAKKVTGATLTNVIDGSEKHIEIDGFFVAIGHKPNTELFVDQLDMDELGYLKTKPGTTQTNIEGVFAAGDVQDHVYRQFPSQS